MAPQPTGPTGPVNVEPGAYGAANPMPIGGTSSEGRTGVSQGYIPPPQKGVKKQGDGSGIYDTNGNLLPFYNLNTRPGEILASFDEKTLRKFTQTLYSRGWYGDKKPGGGLSDVDKNAMENLLYISNLQGRTWEQTFASIAQAPISTGAAGGRVRVTATEDLVELANRTALSTIGRKLTPEEAAKFSAAYQGTQRTDAMGGNPAASADVYFQNRIQKQYGAESEGYKYLSAIGNVAKLLENI